MMSDDRGRKGVVYSLNVDHNISLHSVSLGRTSVRGTEMQPSRARAGDSVERQD